MLDRLQKKWKVNPLQLFLIIATFAIGGSLTGYVSRKLMALFPVSQDWLWVVLFILIVTILWPFAVVLVSIPMGQYPFFIKYISKIGRRLGIGRQKKRSLPPVRLAIFASGAGSNAHKIIDMFRVDPAIEVAQIVTNNPRAGVINIAASEKIPLLLVQKDAFYSPQSCLADLKGIDWIILAGFLWKVPPVLIKAFPRRMVNIHPALLPKYGGKGMFGHYVHEAVIASRDLESGITIHYVDELYDHGAVIFQAKCLVLPEDTPDSLALKIHMLEHEHYPEVIRRLVTGE